MTADATSRTIRSTAGIVWLVVVAVGVAVLLVDALVRGDLQQTLLIAPWLLLIVWTVWTFMAAPHLRAEDAGIVVRNPIRTIEVPWDAVERFAMRWQLEVHLRGDERVQVWSVGARRAPRRGADGDEPRGARELEILADLEVLRAERSAAGTASVRTRWNADVLLVLAALVAWAAVAVAVAR